MPPAPCSRIIRMTCVLPHDALGGVGHEGDVAGHLQRGSRRRSRTPRRRVQEIVEDEADDVRLRVAQVGSAAVVDIAELVACLLDMLARLGLDAAAAGQDERDRRFRDAGGIRDIDDRHPVPAARSLRHRSHPCTASCDAFYLLERSIHFSLVEASQYAPFKCRFDRLVMRLEWNVLITWNVPMRVRRKR